MNYFKHSVFLSENSTPCHAFEESTAIKTSFIFCLVLCGIKLLYI